jgi:hypothetical protein
LKYIQHLYSQERLAEIMRHLGELSPTAARKTQETILTAAMYLNYRLNQERRPTLGEQSVALKSLLEGLDQMLSCWAEFDPSSRERVEDVANNEPQGEDFLYSGGRERVALSIRAIEELREWTKDALMLLKPQDPKKKGRWPERAAIAVLKEIWMESQPQGSLPRFLQFAQAALGPVLKENERNQNLKSLVRSI